MPLKTFSLFRAAQIMPEYTVIESIIRQAEAYRLRAEEIRTTADITRDVQCRETLERLADGYERLAGNLERVAERTARSGESAGTT